MNPATALARLAGKSNFKIEHVDTGEGGLTVHDISHACAHLPGEAHLIALAMWAEDYSVLKRLEYYVWDYAVKVAIDKGWKVPPGKEILRRMARLAISEVVLEHRYKCDTCEGRGIVYKRRPKPVDCPACKGSGKEKVYRNERADWLLIHRTNYYRKWEPRYELIFAHVVMQKNRAWGHIRRNLNIFLE